MDEGWLLGDADGLFVGDVVGLAEGLFDGLFDGEAVGDTLPETPLASRNAARREYL